MMHHTYDQYPFFKLIQQIFTIVQRARFMPVLYFDSIMLHAHQWPQLKHKLCNALPVPYK